MEGPVDTLLPTFCDITGVNPDEGQMYLEMSGYDLNRAVSLYYDNSAPPVNEDVYDIASSSESGSEMEEDRREEATVGRIYSSQGR